MTKRNHSITFVPGYLWKSWRQWHRRDWSQKVPYATCSRDCQQLFHRQLNLSPLGCSQLVVGCWPLDGQVLGSSGANCWPICLRGAEAPQAPSRKGNLHLRKWRTSIHWRWSHTPALCSQTQNFLFVAAALMSQMYKDYKDPDGFLYVTYSGENVFGADTSPLDSCSDHSS